MNITRDTVVQAVQRRDTILCWSLVEVFLIFSPAAPKHQTLEVCMDEQDAMKKFRAAINEYQMRGLLVRGNQGIGAISYRDGAETFRCEHGHVHGTDATVEGTVLEQALFEITAKLEGFELIQETTWKN